MKLSSKNNIFILFYLGYMSIYMARLNLSVASPVMLDRQLLTSVELGFIGSAFSVVYSCGRLFNGILGDRLAPQLLIVTGLIFTGVANLTIGLLPPYVVILAMWCLNAFAQSMLWSSMLRTLTGIYGKAETDRKIPWFVTCVSTGNIAGIILSSQMIRTIGLRAAFFVPGFLTILMGLTSAWVLSKTPNIPTTNKQVLSLSTLFRDRQIRAQLLPAMFHGVLKDNISFWMAVYLLDVYAIDLTLSAWYILLIPTVGLAGRLLYPIAYKLCKHNENTVSLGCFALSLVFCCLLCLTPRFPGLAAGYLGILYAFISMINTSTLSIFPLRFAKQNLVASVSGLTDFFTYLGAGIGSAVYGFMLKDGDYTFMFFSWAVLCTLSILILIYQKAKAHKKAAVE